MITITVIEIIVVDVVDQITIATTTIMVEGITIIIAMPRITIRMTTDPTITRKNIRTREAGYILELNRA
jgi:hypothetical protein